VYDEIRGCTQCGEDFTFTVGEQRFYAENGLSGKPGRCGPGRGAFRTRREPPRLLSAVFSMFNPEPTDL
jgi:hypothetical protein